MGEKIKWHEELIGQKISSFIIVSNLTQDRLLIKKM